MFVYDFEYNLHTPVIYRENWNLGELTEESPYVFVAECVIRGAVSTGGKLNDECEVVGYLLAINFTFLDPANILNSVTILIFLIHTAVVFYVSCQ